MAAHPPPPPPRLTPAGSASSRDVAADSRSARPRRAGVLATVVPTLVAILLFLPALRNGFAYDDVATIVENETLHRVSSLPAAALQPYWPPKGLHYRPVAMLAYGLQWIAGGGEPWVFHGVSLALHALVSALCVRLA